MGKCNFNEGGLLYMVAHNPFAFDGELNKGLIKESLLNASQGEGLFNLRSLANRQIREELAQQIKDAFGYDKYRVIAIIDELIKPEDNGGTKENPISVEFHAEETEDEEVNIIEYSLGKDVSVSLKDIYADKAKTAKGYANVSGEQKIENLVQLLDSRYKGAFKVMNKFKKDIKRDIINNVIVDTDGTKGVIHNNNGESNLMANSNIHEYKAKTFKRLFSNYEKATGTVIDIKDLYLPDGEIDPSSIEFIQEVGEWLSDAKNHNGREMSGSLLMTWSFDPDTSYKVDLYNDFVLLSNFDDILDIFTGHYLKINQNFRGQHSSKAIDKYTPIIDSSIRDSYTNEQVINSFDEGSRLITDMIETTLITDEDGEPTGRTVDYKTIINDIDHLIDKYPGKIDGYSENISTQIKNVLDELFEQEDYMNQDNVRSLIADGIDIDSLRSFYEKFYKANGKSLYSAIARHANEFGDSTYISMLSGIFLKNTKLSYNRVMAGRSGDLEYSTSSNLRVDQAQYMIVENVDQRLTYLSGLLINDDSINLDPDKPKEVEIQTGIDSKIIIKSLDNGEIDIDFVGDINGTEAFNVLYRLFDDISGIGLNPDKRNMFTKRFTIHSGAQSLLDAAFELAPAVYMGIQGARLTNEYNQKDVDQEITDAIESSIKGKEDHAIVYDKQTGKVSVNIHERYISTVKAITKTVMDVDGDSVKSTIKNVDGNQVAAYGLNSLITGIKRAFATHRKVISRQKDLNKTMATTSPLINNPFIVDDKLYAGGSIVDGVNHRGKKLSGSDLSAKNVAEYDMMYAYAHQLGSKKADNQIAIRPTTYSDKSRSTLAVINVGNKLGEHINGFNAETYIDNLAFYQTTDSGNDYSDEGGVTERMMGILESALSKPLKNYTSNELEALYYATQGDYYIRLNEQALALFNGVLDNDKIETLLSNVLDNNEIMKSKATDANTVAAKKIIQDKHNKLVEKYKKKSSPFFKTLDEVNELMGIVNTGDFEKMVYGNPNFNFIKKMFLTKGGVPETFINNVKMFTGGTFKHENFITGKDETFDFQGYMNNQLHQFALDLEQEGVALTGDNDKVNASISAIIAQDGANPDDWFHNGLDKWILFKRNSKGEISSVNPFVKKYFYDFNVFSTNFQNAGVGAEHQHKGEDRATEFISQLKRMVAWQATIHQYNVNTIEGVNKNTNVIYVKDPTVNMQSMLGLEERFDANDGSSFSTMLQAILEQRSLGDTKTGIHRKSIGVTMNESAVAGLTKHADHAITNEKLRGSVNLSQFKDADVNVGNEQYDLINLMKNLMNFELTYDDGRKIDLLRKFNGSKLIFDRDIESCSYILEDENDVSQDKIVTITDMIQNDDGTYTFELFNETDQVQMQPEVKKIETMFDLWQALGGKMSVNALNDKAKNKGVRSDLIANGKQWEYSDTSWYALASFATLVGEYKDNYKEGDLVSQDNVNQPLKNLHIGRVSFESGQKAGVENLTDFDIFYKEYPKPIKNADGTTTLPFKHQKVSNQFMGIQLDASHEMDQSHLTTPTQIISALILSGWTADMAEESYDALAEYIDTTLRKELITQLRKKEGNKELINQIKNKEEGSNLEDHIGRFSEIIIAKYAEMQAKGGRSENDVPITTTLSLAFNDENSGLYNFPIDNPAVVGEFIASASSFFTTQGMRSKLPGILAIISPPTFMSARHVIPAGSLFRSNGRNNPAVPLENDMNVNAAEFQMWKRDNPKTGNKNFYEHEFKTINHNAINALRVLDTIKYTDKDGNTETVKLDHPNKLRDFKKRIKAGDITAITKYNLEPNELRGPEIEINISAEDGADTITSFDLKVTNDLFYLSDFKDSVLNNLAKYSEVQEDAKSVDPVTKVKAIMALAKMDKAFKELKEETNNFDFIQEEVNENGPIDYIPQVFVDAVKNANNIGDIANVVQASIDSSQSKKEQARLFKNKVNALFRNMTTVLRVKQQDLMLKMKEGYTLTKDDLADYFDDNVSYYVSSIDNKPSEMMLSHVFQKQFNLQVNDTPANITEDVLRQRITEKSELNIGMRYDEDGNEIGSELGTPDGYLESKTGDHIVVYESSNDDIPTGYLNDLEENKDFVVVDGGSKVLRLNADGGIMYEFNPSEIEVKTYHDENVDKVYDVWIQKSYKGVEKTMSNLQKLDSKSKRKDLLITPSKEPNGRDRYLQTLNPSEDEVREKASRIALEAKEMFASFQKSLETVIGRIPAQGMQSFMAAKIVGFINTEANAVWTSPYVHWLEGSDFDIDKLNVMFYGVDGKGLISTWAPKEYTNFKDYNDITDTLTLPYPKKGNIGRVTYGEEELENIVVNPSIDLSTPKGKRDLIHAISGHLRSVGDENATFNIDVELADGITAKEIEDFTKEAVNVWNEFNRYNPESDAVLNFTVARIYNVITDPVNARHALSPIEMDEPKAAKEASSKGQEVKKMTKNNPMSVMKMLIANMAGREVIGITASALKAYSVLSLWANKKMRQGDFKRLIERDKDGGFITLNGNKYNTMLISNVNIGSYDKPNVDLDQLVKDINEHYELGNTITKEMIVNKLKNEADTAVIISALLSAATDNAKELVLAAINAGPKTAGIYCYALIMGIPFSEISGFMLSPEVDLVVKYMESDVFGDPTGFTNTEAAIQLVRTGPEHPSGDLFNAIIDLKKAGVFTQEDVNAIKKVKKSERKEPFINLIKSKSDAVEQINKYLNNNMNTPSPENKLIQRCRYLENLRSYLIDTKDFKDNSKLNELEELVIKGKELSVLVSMLSLNQGLKAKPYDILHFKDKVEKGILELNFAALKKVNPKAELKDAQTFDLERFVFDPEQRQKDIDSYNPLTFNILDVISSHPQFMGMLKSHFLNERAIKNSSFKIRAAEDLVNYGINNRFLEAGQFGKIGESHYNKMINFIDDNMISSFLIENAKRYEFQVSGDAMMYNSKHQLEHNAAGRKINLGTSLGRVRFLHWVETHVIPTLKTQYKDNFFVSSLVYDNAIGRLDVSSQNKTGFKLNVDMINTSDDNVARIHELADSFNQIHSIDFKSDGKTSSGKIGEIMYMYNLIMNKGKLNKTAMDKAFVDAYPIKEVKGIRNPNFEFNKFVSESGEKLSVDKLADKMINLQYYAPNPIRKKSKALIKATFSNGQINHTFGEDDRPIGYPHNPTFNEYFLKGIPEYGSTSSSIMLDEQESTRIKKEAAIKKSAFANSFLIDKLFESELIKEC